MKKLNWKNIRLVKFTDGTYGVRKGWMFYSYKDYTSSRHWWCKDDIYFNDCKIHDLLEAQILYDRLVVGEQVIL